MAQPTAAEPTQTERVAALHAEAAAAYAHAQSPEQQAAARGQLAAARMHAQQAIGAYRSTSGSTR